MNKIQRFKLGAGAGLVTMLLGALMVLAPGAGADHTTPTPTVVRGNQACPAGTTDFKIDPPDLSGSTVEVTRDVDVPGEGVTSVTVTYRAYESGGVRHFEWTATETIVRVIVKQGSDSAIFDYPAGATDGDVYVALAPGTKASPLGTSHISFCLGSIPPPPPPATGAISVDKVVTGANQPGSDTAYGFKVTCELDEDPVEIDPDEATFTLTAGADPKLISGLPVGTECTVVEDVAHGATTVTYTVDGVSATPAVATVAEGDPTEVVVTNDFPAAAQTGSISVDKVVTGASKPAPTTAFGFSVTCTSGGQPIDLNGEAAGTAATFTLTDAQAAWSRTGLPVGAQCTVTEPEAQGAGSTTFTVNGVSGNVATVAANANQAVVATNDFPSSTPPPPQPSPTFTYSADIDKLNDADGDGDFSNFETADAAGDDVDFEITIRNTGSGPLSVTSLVDEFDGDTVDLLRDDSLSCRQGADRVVLAAGSVLQPGAVVICTFTLDDYAPAGGDVLTNVVTLDTAEAPDVDDTSTVTTTAVLPDEVEPELEPPLEPELEPEVVQGPTVISRQPVNEVRGSQTVRTLPRTGDETRGLAGVGGLMLALGAAMVLGSKRQLARR